MVKFILNLVNTVPSHNTDGNTKIEENYLLVSKEYLKYIKYCAKSNINPIGTYQFIPADTYAAYLFKEIGSESISKDYEEVYIINLYVCQSKNGKLYFDYKASIKAFNEIVQKIRNEFNNDYKVYIYDDEIVKWYGIFLVEQVNKIFGKSLNIISDF